MINNKTKYILYYLVPIITTKVSTIYPSNDAKKVLKKTKRNWSNIINITDLILSY